MSGSNWTGTTESVMESIGEAMHLVRDAERAYRAGDDRAGRLHAAAESAHRDLLRTICELSDDEADAIEPAFTDFETHLLRLPRLAAPAFFC